MSQHTYIIKRIKNYKNTFYSKALKKVQYETQELNVPKRELFI